MEKEISYLQSQVEDCVGDPFETMEEQYEFVELIKDFIGKRVELERIRSVISFEEFSEIKSTFDTYHMEKYIIKHLKKCIFERLNSYKEFEEKHSEGNPLEGDSLEDKE